MKKKVLVAMIFAVTMITTPMFTNMNAFGDTISQNKQAQEQKAAQAQEQLEKLDNQIQNSMIKAKQLDGQIASANANIKSYQEQIVQTQAKLNTEKKKMDSEIAGLYRAGYVNNGLLAYLNAIFTGHNFSQIVTNIEDVNSINKANQKTLNSIKEQENTLKNQEDSLQSNMKILQDSKSQVSSNLNAQQSAKQKEQGILTDANLKVQAYSAQEIAAQKQKVQEALEADAKAKASNPSNNETKQNVAVSNSTSNSGSSTSNNGSSTSTGNSQASSSVQQSAPQQSAPQVSAGGSATAQSIISYGEQFIGVPYVYGGESPSGFDCSGLMQYIFGHAGVGLPRTAAGQQGMGTPVAKGDLQPGDLVFWGDPAYHVAVYIGGGQILVAPHTGAYVTVMNLYPYTNARRVL